MKISILYIGKPRDANANRMAEDYVERAGRYTRTEMRAVRNPDKLDWDKHASALKVCLDPGGKAIGSRAFANFIRDAGMKSRDLLFLIGGAGGLPEGWR
ncbi:MAG: 23S rRNA (pseudouridine(1915)-N(3))-methyltransferase RlmH, partial [Bryobacteraceae bacterium]